jgi:signal transduction histidine kinase
MTRRSGNGPLALLPHVLILAVTLALASAPQWLSLPVPKGALLLTKAMFSLNGGEAVAVTLPHRWPATTKLGPARGTYRIAVDRPASESLLLLVPAAQHTLTARLDGLRLWGSDRQSWGEAALSSAYVLSVPPTQQGKGVFEIVIDRDSGAVPGHLSQLYLTDQNAVPAWGWLWTLASNGVRIAVIGLQTLVILGIAVVWFARRHDPIFIWLALIGCVSSALLVTDALPTQLFSINGQSMLVFALAAFGAMALGLALSIADIPRPLWLKVGTFGMPLALITGISVGLLPPFITALAGFMMAVGCQLAAAAVLSVNMHARQWDRALMAAVFALTGWYGLRDIGILTDILDGGVLLTPHLRPLTIIAVFILLMRRLASSLEQIDGVNETLRQKLSAQENELSTLHLNERMRMAQAAREDERGRLMRDLHDGLSGHLVSIIALAQARTANPAAIERAARSALDDLRLVINSLDLDDGDLILALAGLRERLEPQLRRLGVDLDWSMEKLPEVTGVTPGNALAVLRILQEAITNALKHGEPSRIAIHGATSTEGAATIVVRNGIRAADEADATDTSSGKGHGLGNITRRAQKLGGNASFDRNSEHATLTLVLPTHLSEG